MKGLIEYLIAQNDKFERELYFSDLDIEIPYNKTDFSHWLEKRGATADTIKTHITRLKTIENDIAGILDYELYETLRDVVDIEDTEALQRIFGDIYRALELLQKEDSEEGYKSDSTYKNYRSSLKKYYQYLFESCRPFEEVYHPKHPLHLVELYKVTEFKEWLENRMDNFETSQQYVANINRLRRDFFSKLVKECKDPFIFMENTVDKHPDKALLLLKKLQERLDEESQHPQILVEMDKRVFKNCRSNFNTYVTFLSGRIK